MMVSSGARFSFSLMIVGAMAMPSVAGLYSPFEKCPFAIEADGNAKELSYNADNSGQFATIFFGQLANVGDPNPNRKNPDRETTLLRLRQPATTPATIAGRAADQMRARLYDEARATLAPLARERQPDYRIVANFAHLFAIRGEWAEAANWHEIQLELTPPSDLAGTTPEQRKWLAKLERTYYRDWLRIHRREAGAKTPAAEEAVFPLFAEPPPDAIAIVQQLLLWHPDDNRLFWLLAELYAREGRYREAERLFDSLVESRQQSNRTRLVERRADIKRRVAGLPAVVPQEDVALAIPDEQKKEPTLADLGLTQPQLIAVSIAFAVAVIGLIALQLRSMRRRR